MRCLVCGSVLDEIIDEDQETDQHPWEKTYKGAAAWKVEAGFGSQFQTIRMVIGLCDKCIEQSLEEGLMIVCPEEEKREERLKPWGPFNKLEIKGGRWDEKTQKVIREEFE